MPITVPIVISVRVTLVIAIVVVVIGATVAVVVVVTGVAITVAIVVRAVAPLLRQPLALSALQLAEVPSTSRFVSVITVSGESSGRNQAQNRAKRQCRQSYLFKQHKIPPT